MTTTEEPGTTYIRTANIPLDELTPFPGNAKRGDVATIQASLRKNGQYRSLVVREIPDGPLIVLAGNHTLQALQAEGATQVRCEVVLCDDATARRINLVDNKAAELGGYDNDSLAELLSYLDGDYEGTGYSAEDVEALITPPDPDELGTAGLTEEDQVPALPADPVTKLGDLWLLGPHRLLCGDSTNPADVQKAVGNHTLTLIHAAPPYGMGKEADGVLNDNLYREKLDAFQMEWWKAWAPKLADNGSAYIWGNAPDLWRLWWTGGLAKHPDILIRNEIVWDKGSGIGMRSEGAHSYPIATERSLFVMFGEQFNGSENQDDYWEGYEPLRAWLEAERNKMGWSNKDVNAITATQMAAHWFSRSQFTLIVRKHYETLRSAAAGRAFTPDYDEVVSEKVRREHAEHVMERAEALRERRTYFDNTHDAMTDVWQFPRVVGEERQGHATPKPVAMVERALKSSSQPGDAIGAPFGGSGPEFIAAEHLDRVCIAIELEPRWADVICRRYQEHTGTQPVLASTGEAHDFTPRDANQ